MASENETVMAVCAEWRECLEAADPTVWNDARIAGLVKTTKAQQLAYLDRIEAAWKRDEERAIEHATRHAEAVARDNCRDCVHNPKGKNYEGGNAAAMRKALIEIRDTIMNGGFDGRSPAHFVNICDAALSAPPRQCDVGTAEEQMKKFREFCATEKCTRYRCRSGCKATCIDRCAIAWAQMPYEAEEGGAK